MKQIRLLCAGLIMAAHTTTKPEPVTTAYFYSIMTAYVATMGYKILMAKKDTLINLAHKVAPGALNIIKK